LGLRDIRDRSDRFFKGVERGAVGTEHGDEDERLELQGKGVRVKVCAVAGDRAGAFQSTQAAMAR